MKRAFWVSMAVLGGISACDAEPAHVYIPGLRTDELAAYGAVASEAVQHAGKVVAPPPGGALRVGKEKPLLGGPGPGEGREEAGRRSLLFRPDRVTELHGKVAYFEVFSPQVAPFKRVSALDAVVMDGDTPVLKVQEGPAREVPVVGLAEPAPDSRPRDRFWGSVILDFREGGHVPLPTVSPETRILSVATEPHVELSITRDPADNLSLRVVRPPNERVRLTYLIDAPRSYFGQEIPSTATDALRDHVPPLPARVRKDAAQLVSELGIDPALGVKAVLMRLVEHFRSFEESAAPPADTGNVFLDLARNRRGVCRHRAYALVITAQYLGIPARLVQNEAHAWVEVELPEVGFVRIDLGGAAEGLEPVSVDDRPRYQPDVPDPWPRPRAYREAYARAAEKQRKDAEKRAKKAAADESSRPSLAASAARGSARQNSDGRPVTLLQVTRFAPEVMRGAGLALSGLATEASGAGIANLRIEVSLAERNAQRAVLLGVGVTDTEGRFQLTVPVPPDLPPEDYALVVVTPGDPRHGAARAD
jgi:hypothetical protein